MKRLTYIDNLRAVGILLVVLVHSLGYTRSLFAVPDSTFWVLENWLHTFLMPFFVFVNGYSFAIFYGKSESDTKRIRSYLARLLQIYLIFGVSMVLLKVVFAQFTISKIGVSDLLYQIIFPGTTMWYIWFLIVMTLVILFKRICTSQSVSGCGVAC